MMSTLFLVMDIETVPLVARFQELSAGWQELWEKKMKTFSAEFRELSPEETWERRAGIYAEFAKVVCIGLGVLDTRKQESSSLFLKMLASKDERELLVLFIQVVEKLKLKSAHFAFAGHNIVEFDLPFLCRRMVAHRLPIPSFMPKAQSRSWDFSAYDTLKQWRFGDYKSFVSLDLLAHVLDIPSSKSAMNGSEVATYYYEKEDVDSIQEYCKQDLILTSNIILRFENKATLLPENIHLTPTITP